MTTARVTQSTARVVSTGTPKARVTQVSVRVVSSSHNKARVTQTSVRIVSSNTPDVVAMTARPQVFVCT